MKKIFLIIATLITVTLVVAITLNCCSHNMLNDLSGLTLDDNGNIFAVNNRPGVLASCFLENHKLLCKKLPYQTHEFERFDMEGITFVGDNQFFIATEKRDNQCLSGCKLSQEVLSFHIDQNSKVFSGHCGSLLIPLLKSDDKDCSFANCGLEGITYASDRNALYVAKERSKPRIYKVELGEDKCPTGEFEEIFPPKVYSGFNDIAYSKARQSLFILSSKDEAFYEWKLATNKIGIESKNILKAVHFLKTTPLVEGIYIDDKLNRLLLLAENGSFIEISLNKHP